MTGPNGGASERSAGGGRTGSSTAGAGEGVIEHGFGKLIGGRLCLDFANTVGGRIGDPRYDRSNGGVDMVVGERLLSYDSLLAWGRVAGVLEGDEADGLAVAGSERPAHAAAVLMRAIAVREAMYRLFRSAIEGLPPEDEDMTTLNGEVRVARSHERLVATPALRWDWDAGAGSLDRVLWPVVVSAAELLTGPEVARLGRCPGERCGWLFLDTSRSRRRQWCDMADCGNVAKVRRFRERQRERDV